jgi:hypothetical protein
MDRRPQLCPLSDAEAMFHFPYLGTSSETLPERRYGERKQAIVEAEDWTSPSFGLASTVSR